MVNVVSFCLYGSHSTYVLGMKENIKLAKEFYIDWKVYIYYNKTVPEKYIKEYEELGAVCHLCENVGKNKMNWEGMFWRWMPLDDPKVEVWVSRDADSRLSEREAKIVNEFIESGKTLHCIRDHRCHFNYIMGGMFGINNKLFHEKYKFKKVKDIIKENYRYYRERPYNVDQIFLNDKLWSLLKNDSMSHISNGGKRVFKEDVEISPVGDFIGKQYRLNDTTSEKANLTSINMVNKTFRIKNLYTKHCFDIENNKVKLRNVSDSDSQLWKMNKDHRIIHLNTNKFLDFDHKKDLIISHNNKNTWKIQEGGFIVHDSNMAVDFKGGLTDKRLEPWLYKFNYSEAQQWEFLEDNSKRIFRIKNVYNNKCFVVENSQVKLALVDNNNEQLWKLDKTNKIVHVATNKIINIDKNRDLVVTENSEHTWKIEDGGFIVNNKNSMAIDVKGGLKYKRNEVWLYNLNYSEAQQWELVDDNKVNSVEIKKLVNKYEKTDINSLYELTNPKTILVLNHKFHHKNKKGLEMICDYLNYNLIYGSEKDIPKADVVYCPSHPFNASKYPNKRFVFGPHLSIVPDNKLHGIQNKDNSVYIQPSPWARDLWIEKGAEKYLPVVHFPYPVDIDKFKPIDDTTKNNVLVMFKYRKNTELTFIENQLKSKNESYRIFKYGSYQEEDYKNYLQTCKYGIWIGTHESQGFGLQEALSCDIPLLVWSVTNLNQQENWRGAPDIKATSIAYWDKSCGEYFYKQDEFEKIYQTFLQNLNNYKPREFVLNTVSVKQCSENFKKVFLNNNCNIVNDDKTLQSKEYDELYFDIGANVGLWALANSKENRKIISIEASPTTFNRLKEKTKNNKNIECLNFAVTDSKDDTITFYEHPWDTISTLNKDWLTSPRSRFCNSGRIKETKVNTTSINKLIEKYGIPDLIKIDVEGGEFQVCKSLSNNDVNILNFEWASEMYDVTEKSLNYLSTIGYNKFHIQTGDEYTYTPKEFEYNLDIVKDILSKKRPKIDMGMVWCTKIKETQDTHIKEYLNSPYKEIPAELLSKYTLDGKIPILDWFDDGRKALLNQNWDDTYIGKYKNLFLNENIKKQISLWKHEPYPYDKAAFNVLMSVEKYNIHNKNVAIIGTTIPWIEAILLNNNNNVTTVEYNVPKCTVDNLTCIHYDDFVKSNTTYDCIFSYSSTEHCGLGRYGDPLDPDGDLTAMKHIYDKLGKDSYLFWGGPVGKDTLVWNVHRIYGPLRLSMLFEGFDDVEWMGFNKQNLFNSPLNKIAKQPLVVLKKQ